MSKERRWSGKDAAESAKEKENRAYDTFAEMIIKKLENVQADWKKPWFTEGALPWPKSIYGKPYHGMNALMLTFLCEQKGYRIPIFATSARINDLNFKKDDNGNRVAKINDKGEKLPFVHVLKGEKAFPVFLSQTNVVHKDTKERITFSDYMDLDEDTKKEYNVYHHMKVYPVFNVDQTNLKEARPELYEQYVKENIPQESSVQGKDFSFPALDCLVTENMWICPIKPTFQDQAYYSPGRDEIVIPSKEQFIKTDHAEAYYGTMLHEMIHSTGSKKHLNRLDKQYDKDSYAREELVAELGAALCCHRYGMDKVIKEDSLPYLKGWLQNLHEKPEFIKTVLKDMKAATALVFTKVELSRQYAEKENQVKEKARETKIDARVDNQEDEDDSIDMDEDGNAVAVGGGLSPDKKQGEEESKEEDKKKENERQEEHHRSFRR